MIMDYGYNEAPFLLLQWICTINNISKQIYLSENAEVSIIIDGIISKTNKECLSIWCTCILNEIEWM